MTDEHAEQKKMEKKRDNELKINKFALDSSINGIAISDFKGILNYVNASFCDMWGYQSPAEVVGRSAIDFWETEEGPKQVIKALNTQDHWFGELVGKRKDGSTFDVQISASKVMDDNGDILCLLGSFVDITEQKLAATKIDKQYRFLLDVFESLNYPFYVINAKDYTIEIANSAAQLYGYNKDSKCYELTHNSENPCGTDEHPCTLEKLKLTKAPVTVEHIHYDKSGKVRNVEVNSYPILNDSGEVEKVIEYALDITARKNQEKALKESETKFRNIIEQSLDGISLVSEQGEVIEWNLACENITGIKSSVAIGKPIWTLVSRLKPEKNNERYKGDIHSNVHSFLETGEVNKHRYEKVYDIHSLDGKIKTIEESLFPVRTQDGFLGCAIIRDITDRQNAEWKLLKSIEEREILFKELKHRMKNNLQLLSSMVDMQILHSKDEQFLKNLQEIQSVIDTMALIYSRAYEGAKIRKFKLKYFINELTSGLLKFKNDTVEMIDISIVGDEVELDTDKAIPIVLIINELIFNSLKHGFIDRSNGRIEIELIKNADHLIIRIEDDGIGFPTDFTLDKVTTLGLRIVQNLIEQLNGELEIKTEAGVKTKIKIPIFGVEHS